MRSEPRAVSSTVTRRRSVELRLRVTKPFRSSVFNALETLAREALRSVAISRGSSGPSNEIQKRTRKPGHVQPIGRCTVSSSYVGALGGSDEGEDEGESGEIRIRHDAAAPVLRELQHLVGARRAHSLSLPMSPFSLNARAAKDLTIVNPWTRH